MSCIYHQTPTNIVQWPILPAVFQTRDCKIQFGIFQFAWKNTFYILCTIRIYTFNFRPSQKMFGKCFEWIRSQNSADYFFWPLQQNYPSLIIAPIPFWEKAPSSSIGLTEKNLLSWGEKEKGFLAQLSDADTRQFLQLSCANLLLI